MVCRGSEVGIVVVEDHEKGQNNNNNTKKLKSPEVKVIVERRGVVVT